MKGEHKMNVYDTANKLASEIKNSEEYKQYKEAKQKIDNNPHLKQKIDEFEKKLEKKRIKNFKKCIQY